MKNLFAGRITFHLSKGKFPVDRAPVDLALGGRKLRRDCFFKVPRNQFSERGQCFFSLLAIGAD